MALPTSHGIGAGNAANGIAETQIHIVTAGSTIGPIPCLDLSNQKSLHVIPGVDPESTCRR